MKKIRKRQTNLEKIAGHWHLELLILINKEKRINFSSLKKKAKPISAKVLAEKLKNLRRAKLARRWVINKRPLKVEYRPTRKGKELAEALAKI
ncbi:helix-turn-helix transcriptional regulator [archaeon]|nr:helix-turn-helix transcriptional regulator [archaeon]